MQDSETNIDDIALKNKVKYTTPRYDSDDFDLANFDTARSLGILTCHQCSKLWKGAQQGEHCPHCNATLHIRKPDSINRTWALLIAACILYIPANMMPVMITSTFFDTHQDTILSGIIFFWISGEWGLAAVVFIASFLVPLLKLTSLFILLVTAQKKSDWRRLERAKLYRMVELIGRWSMLDVFVVSLLVGLVQIQGFAQITAGVGIVAFGAVVVLTMLASLSFDPRLIWDTANSATTKSQTPTPLITNSNNDSPNNDMAKESTT
ncbi:MULTISPECIES: paraquat-inducible protein A [Methylotenera]|uniref:paraquat-inducible protein A n=1 Tax=Methylotenera TaxID=359407 RepID=UPI00037B658B|nr:MULTISPECIES: paraquat-inducible protein A [Methylotenera]